jgi:hypothetical protein
MLTQENRDILANGGLDVAEVEARLTLAAGVPVEAVEAVAGFMETNLVVSLPSGKCYTLVNVDEDDVVVPRFFRRGLVVNIKDVASV